MSIPNLPVDFKDDILASSNTKRKYRQTANDDSTVSFEDVTNYSQEGSGFGAKEVNQTNTAINNIYDERILDLDELELVTEPGFFVDAQAVKEAHDSLNSKIEVLQDTDSTSESAIASNGRALKIYDATENVTYGCWGEGIYTVKPYVPGSPSNWGGMCLVTHVRDTGGGFNSYVKTFFSSDCKVYVMRQAKDGTVEQNWTAQS